ncbi:hypothetical protein [Asticcacaulis excentricus]|uniref:hypothetical protein n=1 Tax=Asticcacaulis excentricus TaxID=78587 RepID=UPI000F81C8B1|nr:hypothetical protein [Asticcacaulis excentricus]
MKKKVALGLWLTGSLISGFIHFMSLAVLALNYYVNSIDFIWTAPVVLSFLIAAYIIAKTTPRPSLRTIIIDILSLTAVFAFGWFLGSLFLNWTYPPNYN